MKYIFKATARILTILISIVNLFFHTDDACIANIEYSIKNEVNDDIIFQNIVILLLLKWPVINKCEITRLIAANKSVKPYGIKYTINNELPYS